MRHKLCEVNTTAIIHLGVGEQCSYLPPLHREYGTFVFKYTSVNVIVVISRHKQCLLIFVNTMAYFAGNPLPSSMRDPDLPLLAILYTRPPRTAREYHNLRTSMNVQLETRNKCQALIFVLRLRSPPGSSPAVILMEISRF